MTNYDSNSSGYGHMMIRRTVCTVDHACIAVMHVTFTMKPRSPL